MKKVRILVIDKNHSNFNEVLSVNEENETSILCENDIELQYPQKKAPCFSYGDEFWFICIKNLIFLGGLNSYLKLLKNKDETKIQECI